MGFGPHLNKAISSFCFMIQLGAEKIKSQNTKALSPFDPNFNNCKAFSIPGFNISATSALFSSLGTLEVEESCMQNCLGKWMPALLPLSPYSFQLFLVSSRQFYTSLWMLAHIISQAWLSSCSHPFFSWLSEIASPRFLHWQALHSQFITLQLAGGVSVSITCHST